MIRACLGRPGVYPLFAYNRPGLVVEAVPGVVRTTLGKRIVASGARIVTVTLSETGPIAVKTNELRRFSAAEHTQRAKSIEELRLGADGTNYSGKRLYGGGAVNAVRREKG